MRPKLAGPGHHVGVLLEGTFGQRIVDRGPDGGLRLTSVEDFCGPHEAKVELTLSDVDAVQAARARLVEMWNDPDEWSYGPIAKNCEHFARYVVLGRQESPQSAGYVVAGLAVLVVAGVAFALARGRWASSNAA